RRSRAEHVGGVYQVFQRGVRRARVFFDERDFYAFIGDLKRLAHEHHVTVFAFCLMSNHVHLCVRTDRDPLSLFMQRLNLRHTKRFNRRYGTTGHLNEAPFGSRSVWDERDLLGLVRYIHRNPVEAKLVQRLEEWPYSSHGAYVGKRFRWVDAGTVLARFGGAAAYRAFVTMAPDAEETSAYALGARREADDEQRKGATRPLGWAHGFRTNPWRCPRPEEEAGVAASVFLGSRGWSMEALRAQSRSGEGRSVRRDLAAELRTRGYTLLDIASVLGCSQATVSRMVVGVPLPELRAFPDESSNGGTAERATGRPSESITHPASLPSSTGSLATAPLPARFASGPDAQLSLATDGAAPSSAAAVL
ncbi:MAG: transposase, partial [Myxococcales bacterium]